MIDNDFLKELQIYNRENAMTKLCPCQIITEEVMGICFEKGAKPNKDNSVFFKMYPERSDKPQHSQRRIKFVPYSQNPKESHMDDKEIELFFIDKDLYMVSRDSKEKILFDNADNPFGSPKLKAQVAKFTHKAMPTIVKFYNKELDEETAMRRLAKVYNGADLYRGKKFKSDQKVKAYKESANQDKGWMEFVDPEEE